MRRCHGENAKGNRDVGAPNLTDAHWLYGGDLDTIIPSVHGGRQGHMPTWDERLTPAEIRTLALYVHDLNSAAMTAPPQPSRRKAWLVCVLVSAGLLLVAGANAHLVYVAFDPSRTASKLRQAKVKATAPPRPLAEGDEMGETEKSYGLLSETSGIGETRDPRLQRHLPFLEGIRWLEAGWRDLGPAQFQPCVGSRCLFCRLLSCGRCRVRARLHPVSSLAGFMIVAPFLAIGLYEKSRAIEEGGRISFGSMLLVRPRAGAQVFFAGLLLCLLMLLWTRAAVLFMPFSSG